MSQIQMSEQDVKVNFKHNGKVYGSDRFIIAMQPGDDLGKKAEEKAKDSRYAIDGVPFELEIESKDLAA